MADETPEPWVTLSGLVSSEDASGLEAFLASLSARETARALSRLAESDRERSLALLGPESAADLLELLSDVQASEIIEDLTPSHAAAIVGELTSDDMADVLAGLEEKDAEAILEHMEPADAVEARQLLQYEPDSAGGLMLTEYVAYTESSTIGTVIEDLRARAGDYSDYHIQYVYITDTRGRLRGVLRLRDLLLARRTDSPVSSVMIRDPVHVTVDTRLRELKSLFENRAFVGVPVTDRRNRLAGVVRRAAVEAALGASETRTYMRLSGLATAEEIRTMPTWVRSYRRLAWLSVNILLNIVAASVIVLYQDTLSAVIALAVFLPIISDMSGCSGNQAVAVSIRELALGLVRPYEFVRVVAKEGTIGVINGAVLGTVLGTVAALWQNNVYIGLVVGGALALNTLLAVVLGGTIPLALKAMKLDPALASGPILTTVTDMFGFFLVLSFATLVLSRLVG